MPPKHVRRGLRPSILDLLTDPESGGKVLRPRGDGGAGPVPVGGQPATARDRDALQLTGYSVDDMSEAVLRDLEDLLNTVHTARDVPAEYDEVLTSIVAYGLPDLGSAEAVSADQRAAIGRTIRQAVERFEPRLRQVRVTLISKPDDVKTSLKFRIDARLNADPAPDVAFDTILEVGTGKYLVTPAA